MVAKALVATADALAIGLAMYLAYLLGEIRATDPVHDLADYRLIAVLSLPLWLLVFARYGLYSSRRVHGRLQEFRALFHALVVGTALFAGGLYAIAIPVARRWVILLFVFGLLLLVFEREICRRIFVRLRLRGRFMRRVVIIGANDEGSAIADMLDARPSLGYEVVGLVDDLAVSNGRPVLGRNADLIDLIETHDVGGAIVATTSLDLQAINRIVRQLTNAGVHVELSSSLRDIASQRLLVRPLGDFPVVYLDPVRRHGWRALAKRVFDIVASAGALVVLSPVMLVVALLIKLDSKGPVLFRQQRVGKDGVLFTILKFRTMVADAERRRADLEDFNLHEGPLFKMSDDPRVTRVGKVLRRISLDEVPQFWNVLRGEMSVVGPRPALPAEATCWEPELRQRLRVRPGLTGMWQVRPDTTNSFESYSRLDLYYVDNWSLIIDLAIVLRTIPIVLRRHGVR